MKKLGLILVFSVFFCSFGYTKEEKKTVCLNMIIKDESKVICRCLESVKPIIDYWVIVDTGSTDGTQEMVKNFMKDIPGELHETTWVNFEHNRNHALDLARDKGDYILFIDADEELVYEKDFQLPNLEKDFYYITSKYGGSNYVRNQMIKSSLNWKWRGVVHEIVWSDQARNYEILNGVHNFIRPFQGCRSRDEKKYWNDAMALEKALKKNPNNTRDVFYLAQSYRDCGELELSIKNYERRIALGGWDQEVFWSMFQIGKMQQQLKMDPKVFTESLLKAYVYRPIRAEPLYYLANHYRSSGDHLTAYLISSLALKVPYPDDILFVERWVYDYGLLMEFSVAAYWLQKYGDALQASIKILECKDLPEHVRSRTLENMRWIQKQIAEKKAQQQKAVEAQSKVVHK